MSRVRTRVVTSPTGQVQTFDNDGTPGRIRTSGITLWREHSDDIADNPGGNNPWIYSRSSSSITPFNGVQKYNSGNPYKVYTNWYDTRASAATTHLSITIPALTGLNLAARMSPNRPLVDIPVFFAELRDVPGMVKDLWQARNQFGNAIELIRSAGESISRNGALGAAGKAARKAGKANLAYSFGWSPLVDDLLKALKFQEAFERRRRELENLYKPEGLRRRVSCGSDSNSTTYNDAWESSEFGHSGLSTKTTTGTQWATSRWKSYGQPPPSSESEKDWEAIRSLFGLGFSAAALWQAMPWSWMIDWFTNAGDYLEANRNTIPAKCETVSLMTHIITTETRTVLKTPAYVKGGRGHKKLESKRRQPLTLSTTLAGFPFLGAGQVGILASLSVARRNAWK